MTRRRNQIDRLAHLEAAQHSYTRSLDSIVERVRILEEANRLALAERQKTMAVVGTHEAAISQLTSISDGVVRLQEQLSEGGRNLGRVHDVQDAQSKDLHDFAARLAKIEAKLENDVPQMARSAGRESSGLAAGFGASLSIVAFELLRHLGLV